MYVLYHLSERKGRGAEAGAEELGAGGEEPLFLSTPSSMDFARERSNESRGWLLLFIFLCYFPGALLLLGQTWAEGKWELATELVGRSKGADGGQETDSLFSP